MENTSVSTPDPKVQSISRRFSYAFIGVVTLILLGFATIASFVNITRIQAELENRVKNALRLSNISLPAPLWKLDNDSVNDFIVALFLDQSLVYAEVSWGGRVIAKRIHPKFQHKDFAYFKESGQFIVRTSDILYEGSSVGTLQLAVSRESIKKELMVNIAGIIVLTLLLIAAISLTSMVITKRYISRPLSTLQHSAALIAQGDLDAAIATGSRDEIGRLAQDLNVMRGSIKQLFGALRDSNAQLEEYNSTLEQRVEERTAALARSVAELQALWEVSQAVSSTLDLHTVLSTIVSYANQLSEADGGAIYEYDESTEEFQLHATQQFDPECNEALRATRLRMNEGAIGRAVAARKPVQIPDMFAEGVHEERLHGTLARFGFRALLAVPMLRENRVVGGLVVCRKSPGAFPSSVVDLLQTCATQSTLAIQNARLFREIEERGHQLEIASQHKSQFLASMSHELRTPLNAIIGFSDVLLEKMFGELNAKQEEYLNDILSSGQYLLSLINDILDLAKVEAGGLELELGVVDLRPLLEGSLVMVRERALAHSITLALEVAADVTPVVGDARKVKQILFNLLSNAVKFTPDKGSVGIRATQAGEAVQIAVWDTGMGIAPEDQQRIFEEFQQVGQGLTGKPEGTGLGLALAKKFVELHGGVMWVDSLPGRGSTFTFTLPTARAAAHTPLSTAPHELAPHQRAEVPSPGPLVLVIEDDPKAAALLRLYLTEAGYTVDMARDGAEGLEKVKRLSPDAVILDVLLPKVDGWAFLTQVKADPTTKDVPVIIVSIVDQKGKGFALGAAEYLVKPVQKEMLLGTLRAFGLVTKVRTTPVTVLAIDDDPKAVELLVAALEPEGCRVLKAAGGEEGLRLAETARPDLIILDLLMPGMNGFEVLDRLAQSPAARTLPVILFTVKQLTAEEKQRVRGRIARLAQKETFNRKDFAGMVRDALQRTLGGRT